MHVLVSSLGSLGWRPQRSRFIGTVHGVCVTGAEWESDTSNGFVEPDTVVHYVDA